MLNESYPKTWLQLSQQVALPRWIQRCGSDADIWDTGRHSCSGPVQEPMGEKKLISQWSDRVGIFCFCNNKKHKRLGSWPCPPFFLLYCRVATKGNGMELVSGDYRDVNFSKHLDSSASIQQSNILWCWNNYCTCKMHIKHWQIKKNKKESHKRHFLRSGMTCYGNVLSDGQLDISCPGRHVYH